MRTIQDVGKEILSDNPKKLYIFLGKEYILKEKYIEFVTQHYSGNVREVNSYDDFTQIMRSTSFILPLPTNYIIRYDSVFIKQLSKVIVSELLNAVNNLNGTLIFVYEQDSDAKKLDKFFADYTVTFFPISTQLQLRYLSQDYNGLNEIVLNNIIQLNCGYSISDKICNALSYCTDSTLITNQSIKSTFLSQYNNIISSLQLYFADKNYAGICRILDSILDLYNIHYKLLSVIIELMKVRKSSYMNSAYKQYAPKWTNSDLYNMFNIIYNEIINLRTKTSDAYNSILYIATFLCYDKIPEIV